MPNPVFPVGFGYGGESELGTQISFKESACVVGALFAEA